MLESESFVVESEVRLDKLLCLKYPSHSRTYFQHLIDNQLVFLNGNVAKKREIPKLGDLVKLTFPTATESSLEPENIALNILYEDDELLVINKPANLVVHPGAGNPSHTLANALLYHCKQLINNTFRPGIVHRLDKDTTGVLLCAKNEKMQEKLSSLFATRQIKKEYMAVTVGNPGARTIVAPIGRHPIKRQQMTICTTHGKEAITEVNPIKIGPFFSLLSLLPKTGRTHQLRVHLKYTNTPILGDPLYGNLPLNKKYHILRPLLHAYKLHFTHPTLNQEMTFSAPLPPDFSPFQ